MEGKQVNSTNIDLLVIQATKTRGNRKIRVNYSQFLNMLVAIAGKRFPRLARDDPAAATEELLLRYICPLSERIVKSPVEESTRNEAPVAKLLSQLDGVLSALFGAYAEGISMRSGAPNPNWSSGFGSGDKTPRGRGLSVGGGGVTGMGKMKSYGGGKTGGLQTMAQEELIKLAEDLGLVPHLVSKMEVGRLLKAVTPDTKSLNYDQFLHWICRAAVRGFSKAPYNDQFPTNADKVEKMLTLIDDSAIVQSVLASKGKRHNRTFARRHNESVARGAKSRDDYANARQTEVVDETRLALERSEFGADFAAVFRFYSHYGEEGKEIDTIKGFNFFKLFRDCDLIDDNLSHERVDLIFLQHAKPEKGLSESGGKEAKPANRKPKMSYNGFLGAVSEVASRKFPNVDRFVALVNLITRHILPGARRVEHGGVGHLAVFSHMRVAEIYARDSSKRAVRGLFLHYAGGEGTLSLQKPPKMTLKREGGPPMLSLYDVRSFTDDFGISGRVVSQKDILGLFRASVGIGAPSHGEAKTMDYHLWEQFLCRLAMHWGRVDATASAEDVAQRLHKFLRTLENAAAMSKVE